MSTKGNQTPCLPPAVLDFFRRTGQQGGKAGSRLAKAEAGRKGGAARNEKKRRAAKANIAKAQAARRRH